MVGEIQGGEKMSFQCGFCGEAQPSRVKPVEIITQIRKVNYHNPSPSNPITGGWEIAKAPVLACPACAKKRHKRRTVETKEVKGSETKKTEQKPKRKKQKKRERKPWRY